MPAPSMLPLPFEDWAIDYVPPWATGVYVIYGDGVFGRRPLYVGQGFIRDRLHAHQREAQFQGLVNRPTDFVYEMCIFMDQRERELIAELNPLFNVQRPAPIPPPWLPPLPRI